jgi:hypothetical protein
MHPFVVATLLAFACPVACGALEPGIARQAVAAMKDNPRGPFARIRWFCKDGAILPPAPYGCRDHGGGSQHGEWSESTLELRASGYQLANVYADLDVEAFIEDHAAGPLFAQMLIEQFLVRIDDGWILRQAQFYRGAFQEEGERKGKRALLLALIRDSDWITHRYLMLRTAAALLEHGTENQSVQNIRSLAAALAEQRSAFIPLRNKIHANPAPQDAGAVRRFAANVEETALRERFESLAGMIDGVYQVPLLDRIRAAGSADYGLPSVNETLAGTALALAGDATPRLRFGLTARLMADLRDVLPNVASPARRLQLLDLSLRVADAHYAAGAVLANETLPATRAEQIDRLRDAALAAYGAGLISAREKGALERQFASLAAPAVDLNGYKEALDYLALPPTWGTQSYRYFFAEAMDKLGEIEPLARLFIQDQLRGSPLFNYADLIDELLRDANRLAGVQNDLFGERVGGGLRALNPGLARGVLHLAPPEATSEFDQRGIYLLPETVADLPPVAGIVTQGEGNPLSHVQLLARNLGIPNVAIDQRLVDRLRPHDGTPVVLAVSAGGSVQLVRDEGQFAGVFAAETAPEVLIEPDLAKLDLSQRELRALSELRAGDSGRTVGPKAAKLGELKHHYPEAVAEGLAIPFGVFREVLDRPARTGGTIWEWMVAEYRRFERIPADDPARPAAVEAFRQQFYDTILAADLGAEFRARLEARMQQAFGADGSYGVFVRSDTNVEDLPGFTGAGLNLTVPNVVGFDNVLAAIARVWASPFTARAFAWRQSHMRQPEHVYPAVLLMRSVDVEKSGVLVTKEIDSGDPGWLSVAVNEGVGGAVDGQSAESLRINVATGDVRLRAQATAPWRRKIDPAGGVRRLPVSGSDAVLKPDEIRQLIDFARGLPERFPPITDAKGAPAPADVEFGFLHGELHLFQIRPFLDSDLARSSAYLQSLDRNPAELAGITVDLNQAMGFE